MRSHTVAAVLVLLLAAASAQADFYRWVDGEGKEFFTNDPLKVPGQYRSGMTKVEPDESRVNVGGKPATAGKEPAGVPEHRDRQGRGEQYWRARAAKLRKELAILQEKYEVVLKQEKEDEGKPKKLSSNAGSKKKKGLSARDKKKATLERDIARKKHELEVELPEEARKSEAYPGWIRE